MSGPFRHSASLPTFEEMARWRRFLDETEKHAGRLLAWREGAADAPVADKMAAALKRVRKSIMPEGQQMRGSPLATLFTRVSDWPGLTVPARVERAPELLALVAEVRGAIESHDERRQRRAGID